MKLAECPFCETRIPRPKSLPGSLDMLGGRCKCGVLYLFDETGKQGGQLLLDGLTLICDGDMDQAMELSSGSDYELKDIGYNPRTHTEDPKPLGRGSFGRPKLFFLKRL